jgi:lipid-A-disaccharide synthase-like uncharacterized protein
MLDLHLATSNLALDLTSHLHSFKIALHPWKIVGLSGSIIFGLRFFIQWIASERAGKSVIPFGFWECSALGSFLTLAYFAIYQRDSVGVINAVMPLPIYLRNLYFRYKRSDAQEAVKPQADAQAEMQASE